MLAVTNITNSKQERVVTIDDAKNLARRMVESSWRKGPRDEAFLAGHMLSFLQELKDHELELYCTVLWQEAVRKYWK